METNHLRNQLANAHCSECGADLRTASLTTITEMPLLLIAQAKCSKCKSENMVTVTSFGSGVFPLVSDLRGKELSKFINKRKVTTTDVLNIHKKLKKESVWNLLQQNEKS